MRIAVIGAGVSGSVCARLLATRHDVVLFEAERRPGGHALTVDVPLGGRDFAADVGFMVYNRRTYPNFCRLLDALGVATRESDMSFSVRSSRNGLEYQGSSLGGLFAQRRNLASPAFLRMLSDVVRFNRAARAAAANGSLRGGGSVGEFLDRLRVGRLFRSHYLAPMAAAIWSAPPGAILAFPAEFLVGFFANHGLVQLQDRPRWRTILGGSRTYVDALLGPLGDRLRRGVRVERVRRIDAGVEVACAGGSLERFDEAVLAVHADQALAMLADATPGELRTLGAFPYQQNQAVLHTDTRALPSRRRAWASWNYHVPAEDRRAPSVTYDLSRLQGIESPTPILLTLNEADTIDPARVLGEFSFAHPAYGAASIAAQQRWSEVSGANRVHFCGAYWGYGFHEDGVRSALAVTQTFGVGIEACTAACIGGPSPTVAAAT